MRNTADDGRDAALMPNGGQVQGFRAMLQARSCDVEWDQSVLATDSGGMVYFAQFLSEGHVFREWVDACPLRYTSNNAPEKAAVLATVVVGVVKGAWRYAHMGTVRHDRLLAGILNVPGLVSEDAVRRAFGQCRRHEREWNEWLSRFELATLGPLLTERYVLDLDTTIKPLYGHQEGAELGYNPQKKGRPSHAVHTAFIGALRLVFSIDEQAGKRHAARHLAPGLWARLDALPPESRPALLRGDVAFGCEEYMCACEARGLDYLFKLRRTTRIRDLVRSVAARAQECWQAAADGWETCEARVRLTGWCRDRRVVVARRPAQHTGREHSPSRQQELALMDTVVRMGWEYTVLVTAGDLPADALLQLYRERADCENVFDELKNQWGLGGFVTHDIQRCRVMARIVALLCNWWNVFARLADPSEHMEAITSRPLLLQVMAQAVRHAGRTVLRLSSHHGLVRQVRTAFTRLDTIFRRLSAIAEQLGKADRWPLLLSLAFVKWLRGRVLTKGFPADPVLTPLLACTS
jgi:hypothetical protein